MTLQELRDKLGICQNEYKRWDNFKRKILDGSQQALEENTDICFDYDLIKMIKEAIIKEQAYKTYKILCTCSFCI